MMNQATYDKHMGAMSSALSSEFAIVCDEHKAEILGFFPMYARVGLAVAWWCLKKVGAYLAPYLVQALLWYLATKTLAEIMELFAATRQKMQETAK